MFSRGVVSGLCLGLSVAALASAARAERPRASYRWVDPSRLDVAEAQHHSSNVIYLNPCAGGCTIQPGWDDSRIDTSSIVTRTVTISEFAHGPAAWDAVVSCVAGMYEPFGVVVTDVDPGSAPHFEAIVAGAAANIGANGIGGLSPFTCGVIDNAITYSFANMYGSVQDICETVAQETAHAFGLEHEYLCEDPMTYLTGCGAKSFQDTDAACGEFSPRDCECGGATQNSFQMLLREFDAGQPTPPALAIVAPRDGDLVQPGFVVEVEAGDNVGIGEVAVWLNDQLVAESGQPPFVFNAPDTLAVGPVAVRVQATDNRGETSEKTITVEMGAPCSDDDSCAGGEVCRSGRCEADPGDDGSGGCRAAGESDGGGAAGGLGTGALVLFACCLMLGRRRSKEAPR